jgi:SAM-dependent methyltransferase
VTKIKAGLSWKGYEGRDYEEFWTGPAKQYLDEVEHLIASSSLPGGDSVVEIGAGFGRLGDCYVGKYRESHMVEPANNLREIAARTYGNGNVHFHEASVYELPFADASIDAALMVRVFHHLDDPEKALREIHRIIRPGGRLVFNYSNIRNIKRLLQFFAGRVENPFKPKMVAYYPSLIGHHPRYVENLLWSLGFEIEKRYGVGITDKVVGIFPWIGKIVRPSLFASRLAGSRAPAVFIVARRK